MANNRADNPAFNQLYSPPEGFAPQFVNGPSTSGGIKMQSSIPQSSASQSSGTNFLSSVGNFLSGALGSFPNPIGTAINAITGIVGGISQRKENERNRQFEMDMAQQQREWNEQMMDKQNQWNIDQWNRENAYNSPAAQLDRLRDAGMNPLFYGLDGNSANQLQSAQALGYDRASVGNQVNPFTVGMNAASSASQMGIQAKQSQLLDAQIDKVKSETHGIGLENEWKSKTMAARVEASELANSLTKSQIAEIDDKRKEIQQNIKKLVEETKNEVTRGLLLEAEKNLKEMQTKEIAELLPYKKLLIQAETQAQKASAAAAFVKAAIDKGLLDAGYVDKVIEGLRLDNEGKEFDNKGKESEATRRKYESWLTGFKANIRTGNAFDVDSDDPAVYRYVGGFINNFLYSVSVLADVVTSPISGIFK